MAARIPQRSIDWHRAACLVLSGRGVRFVLALALFLTMAPPRVAVALDEALISGSGQVIITSPKSPSFEYWIAGAHGRSGEVLRGVTPGRYNVMLNPLGCSNCESSVVVVEVLGGRESRVVAPAFLAKWCGRTNLDIHVLIDDSPVDESSHRVSRHFFDEFSDEFDLCVVAPIGSDVRLSAVGYDSLSFKLEPELSGVREEPTKVVMRFVLAHLGVSVLRPDTASVSLRDRRSRLIRSGGSREEWTNVPPGEYELRVMAPGYRTQTQRLSLTAGETEWQSIELEPLPLQLMLSVSERGAEVFEDGQSRGVIAGKSKLFKIDAAVLSLQIQKPGFKTHFVALAGQPGELRKLSVTLEPGQGQTGELPCPADFVRYRPTAFKVGCAPETAVNHACEDREPQRDVEISVPWCLQRTEVSIDRGHPEWRRVMGVRDLRFSALETLEARARESASNDDQTVEDEAELRLEEHSDHYLFSDLGGEWESQATRELAKEYANARSKIEGLEMCYQNGTLRKGCLGYRLPTEVEWEFAASTSVDPDRGCSGSDDSHFSWITSREVVTHGRIYDMLTNPGELTEEGERGWGNECIGNWPSPWGDSWDESGVHRTTPTVRLARTPGDASSISRGDLQTPALETNLSPATAH